MSIGTPRIDRAIEALLHAEEALGDLPGIARPPAALLGGVAGLTPEQCAKERERLEKTKVHLLAAVSEVSDDR